MSRTVCWAFLVPYGLVPAKHGDGRRNRRHDTKPSGRGGADGSGPDTRGKPRQDRATDPRSCGRRCPAGHFPRGGARLTLGHALAEYRLAVQAVGKAAGENNVYVVAPSRFVPQGQSKHHNQLYVFSPQGETLLVYDKVWHARQYDAPRMVSVDGVLCSFMICARPLVEACRGSSAGDGWQDILIECSGNYDTEWLPSLEWYWYVPRAIRNTAYVILSNRAAGEPPARRQSRPWAQRGGGSGRVDPRCRRRGTGQGAVGRFGPEQGDTRNGHPPQSTSTVQGMVGDGPGNP